MSTNRQWLEIIEYISIGASAVGAVLAIILERIVYVSAPVSLALLLNLVNRQRLALESKQRTSEETSQLHRHLGDDLESLRASILALASQVDSSRIESELETIVEEIATTETNIQTSLTPLKSLDLHPLRDDVEQLRNQSTYVLDSLASILQRLDNSPAAETINALENRVTQLSADLAAMGTEIKQLIGSPAPVNIEPIRESLERLGTDYSTIQESLTNVNRRLEELPRVTDKLERFDTSLTQLSEKLSVVESEMQTRLASLDIETWKTSSGHLDSIRENIGQLGEQSASLLTSIIEVVRRLENLPLPASTATPELLEERLAELAETIQAIPTGLNQKLALLEVPALSDMTGHLQPIRDDISQLSDRVSTLQLTLENLEKSPPVDEEGNRFSDKAEKWLKSEFDLLKNQSAKLQESLENLGLHKPKADADDEGIDFPGKAEKWFGAVSEEVRHVIDRIEGRKKREAGGSYPSFEDDDFDDFEDIVENEIPPENQSKPNEHLSVPENQSWQLLHTLTGNSSAVTGLAITADSGTIVSGGYEAIALWDLNAGSLRQNLSLESPEILVSAIALSPDGTTLAGATGEIEIWNLSTGKRLQTMESDNWTTAVAISPDGKLMASGGGDPVDQNGSVQLWNFATGELMQTHYYVEREIYSLAFSYNGEMLAVAGGNADAKKGIIELWNLGSGKPLCTLEPSVAVYSVAIAFDCQMLVGGCSDNTIKLWNPATSGLVRTFSGHSGEVYAIALSPDGQTLASGSSDATIKLWNLETGELLDTLSGHSGGVRSLAFSQDGKILVSGSQDMTIRVWKQCSTNKNVKLEDKGE